MWNKLINWIWYAYKTPVTCESNGHIYSVIWKWISEEEISTYRLVCMRCGSEQIDLPKLDII